MAGSATADILKDPRRQLKCVMAELFLWLRKITSEHLTKSRTILSCITVKVKRCPHEWKVCNKALNN